MTGTHSYRTHRLQNVQKRRTCDVNVIFKNSVNLACLPIIADHFAETNLVVKVFYFIIRFERELQE